MTPTLLVETQRLSIRHFDLDDAAFVVELVNDPSWLRFIGDRGVTTEGDARQFLAEGYLESYQTTGLGMYLVESKADHEPMGVCGLLQRDYLDAPDLGFAFLPRFWGQGFARESAVAVMDWGRATFGFDRLLAITSPDNTASIRLLEAIGFRHQERQQLSDDDEVLVLAHTP